MKVITNLSGIISLVLYIYGLIQGKSIREIDVFIIITALTYVIGYLYYSKKSRPIRFSKNDTEKINKYMRDLIIRHNTNTFLLTRDLSWVEHDEDVENCLMQKSKNHNLTICTSHENNLMQRLRSQGAEIKLLPENDFKSRFTIINYRTESERIFVRQLKDDYVYIHEYSEGSHPFYTLARDMIKNLKSRRHYNRKNGN